MALKTKTNKSNSLSAADKLILDSYKTTMEGLASYFGEAFEFVLHNITDVDHSIIKIINGSHSGRREGSPITDFALSMLERIRENDASKPFMSYTTKCRYGRPIRSTTIIIFGEENKVIGMLCVNLHIRAMEEKS
jgi:predicted transcriptional regulator YheO